MLETASIVLKQLMNIFSIPGGTIGKESTCQCQRHKRCKFDPWVERLPWRKTWQPTAVFLSGKFQGQRSLAGYSPWGCKSQTRLSNWTAKTLTNTTCTHTHTYTHTHTHPTHGCNWWSVGKLTTEILRRWNESSRSESIGIKIVKFS